MFKKIMSIFGSSSDDNARRDPAEAKRLAVATLLVEAARADESYTDEEKAVIDQALGAMFNADHPSVVALRVEAEAAQADAVDLHSSTKIAKTLSAKDKTRLVESLWTIILSDGDKDVYEDALVRRICGLIHFSDRESGEARQRVAAKMAP